MKPRMISAGGAVALFCVALLAIGSGAAPREPQAAPTTSPYLNLLTAPQPSSAQPIGRYSLTTAGRQEIFIHDTTTGECWQYDGHSWRSMGKPIATPIEPQAQKVDPK